MLTSGILSTASCFRTTKASFTLLSGLRRALTRSRCMSTMKLNSPEFKALFTDELEYLSALFKKYNHDVRIAGGPVRDLLMGITPDDIDLATTATPTQMKELFEKENVRMLHKRGEEHGTITCRINDKTNFEITTLRIDIVCDGRRAEVKYTTDWEKDAFRRDLTINSLFLGLDGTVYDYTGGINDVENRVVRFVGDAEKRIQEDYLRILRYFRFFGRIAKEPNEHDPETLAVIEKNKGGIEHLSGERIWMELKKILVGRFAPDVIRVMVRDCGLAPLIALPPQFAAQNLDVFARASQSVASMSTANERKLPCTVLSNLLGSLEDVDCLNKRLKVSAMERTLCEFLVENRAQAEQNKSDIVFFRNLILRIVHEHGAQSFEPVLRACFELLKVVDAPDTLQQLRDWAGRPDVFPLTGLTLLENGIPKGPQVRNLLRHLHEVWIQSECALGQAELLELARSAPNPQTSGGPARKRRWTQMS